MLRIVIILFAILFFNFSSPCYANLESKNEQLSRVILAENVKQVSRKGTWHKTRFRFAQSSHLYTKQDNASLEYQFEGTGISLRFGGHDVPAYGSPNLGLIAFTIDGGKRKIIKPRSLPREVILANNLSSKTHVLQIEHLNDRDLSGCRIESFRTWNKPLGDLRFQVNGEKEAFLVDCRVILRHGDTVIRNALVRNWLTGQCSLTGIPSGEGYTMEVRAAGWQNVLTDKFNIQAGKTTQIPPVYLKRDLSTVIHRFRHPHVNQPVVSISGDSFRARFLGFNAAINEVRVIRKVGPAVISRLLEFKEDKKAGYYYDREVVATLPESMPSGVYDLEIKVAGGGRTGTCRSPRSVHVVQKYSTDPVFVSFGHFDTSAQYQAEHLERLVSVINLLAPDMVLCSTACNPAYISGAFSGLDVPYSINFGNHQFPGHEEWFGDPVSMIDCGPHVSILNYGRLWHTGTSRAEALLASRQKSAIRIINAFEPNAPIDFLNRHRVSMIHFGHGLGKRVEDVGETPTRRVGKTNSESFRIVRFRNNQVESCTYNGHKTKPFPFKRGAALPLSVIFSKPNDGTKNSNNATVTNRLLESYPDVRVTFIVPAGKYNVKGGRLESQIVSDDGQFNVLSVRTDVPKSGSVDIGIEKVE